MSSRPWVGCALRVAGGHHARRRHIRRCQLGTPDRRGGPRTRPPASPRACGACRPGSRPCARRMRHVEVHHVGAEPLRGQLERAARARRRFEEDVGDGEAGEARRVRRRARSGARSVPARAATPAARAAGVRASAGGAGRRRESVRQRRACCNQRSTIISAAAASTSCAVTAASFSPLRRRRAAVLGFLRRPALVDELDLQAAALRSSRRNVVRSQRGRLLPSALRVRRPPCARVAVGEQRSIARQSGPASADGARAGARCRSACCRRRRRCA